MNEVATMALVHSEDARHARSSDMLGTQLATCLKRLATIAAVWMMVALFCVLATFLRVASGELVPGPGWLWTTLAIIPLWTATTPPVIALSRQFPLGRGTWPLAVVIHLAALVGVLAVEGVINMFLSPRIGTRELTYGQQMWRYTFIDAFFYAGVVAVEHAARYYRLYLDRRVRASELEAQVSRAQLQALQMQIHPHFLFNTLNTISGLVRVDDKPAAISMLAGLGDLLRLLLRSDGAHEVPVHQELELIERYLEIEQVRFGDRLAVEVKVEPGVEDALVPNLILQPLVENAVRHGIGAATGRVSVHVGSVGQTLRMAVSDTGEAHPRNSNHLGIGLTNTRARLERLYAAEHRFELAQTVSGTSAIIEIPLHHEPRLPA